MTTDSSLQWIGAAVPSGIFFSLALMAHGHCAQMWSRTLSPSRWAQPVVPPWRGVGRVGSKSQRTPKEFPSTSTTRKSPSCLKSVCSEGVWARPPEAELIAFSQARAQCTAGKNPNRVITATAVGKQYRHRGALEPND